MVKRRIFDFTLGKQKCQIWDKKKFKYSGYTWTIRLLNEEEGVKEFGPDFCENRPDGRHICEMSDGFCSYVQKTIWIDWGVLKNSDIQYARHLILHELMHVCQDNLTNAFGPAIDVEAMADFGATVIEQVVPQLFR